jgi:hypothetical protein
LGFPLVQSKFASNFSSIINGREEIEQWRQHQKPGVSGTLWRCSRQLQQDRMPRFSVRSAQQSCTCMLFSLLLYQKVKLYCALGKVPLYNLGAAVSLLSMSRIALALALAFLLTCQYGGSLASRLILALSFYFRSLAPAPQVRAPSSKARQFSSIQTTCSFVRVPVHHFLTPRCAVVKRHPYYKIGMDNTKHNQPLSVNNCHYTRIEGLFHRQSKQKRAT